MPQPLCIAFAGVPGSQKTPLGAFLSVELGLPVLEHDEIRYEIRADTMTRQIDPHEFDRRRTERRRRLLERGQSFIYDASVDRHWPELKAELRHYGYHWFIISMDLSEALLDRLEAAGAKGDSEGYHERWAGEHRQFLKEHAEDVGLSITDTRFPDRNQLAVQAIRALTESSS